MPSTTIQRGNISSTTVIQVALTPAATGATTSAEQTFTVPGLILATDQISGVNYLGANVTLVDITNYRVSANNTLGLTFQNPTAGSLTFPSGNFLVEVNRIEAFPLPANLA